MNFYEEYHKGLFLDRYSLIYIYINDIFHVTELANVCNYADDTTFHACDSDTCSLIQWLEHDSLLAIHYYLKVTT